MAKKLRRWIVVKKDAVILFAGRKGVGKNTAATVFLKVAKERGLAAREYAYADELRAHLAIMNPIVGRGKIYCGSHPDVEIITWNEAIETYGYEGAKQKFPEMRRLMQVYGTEVVRQRVASDYWTQKLKARIKSDQNFTLEKTASLVTDVRFENEALCWGGFKNPSPFELEHTVFIYVDRPFLHKEVDPHSSESFAWLLEDAERFKRVVQLTNASNAEEFSQKAENLAHTLFDAMPGFGQRTSTNP